MARWIVKVANYEDPVKRKQMEDAHAVCEAAAAATTADSSTDDSATITCSGNQRPQPSCATSRLPKRRKPCEGASNSTCASKSSYKQNVSYTTGECGVILVSSANPCPQMELQSALVQVYESIGCQPDTPVENFVDTVKCFGGDPHHGKGQSIMRYSVKGNWRWPALYSAPGANKSRSFTPAMDEFRRAYRETFIV